MADDASPGRGDRHGTPGAAAGTITVPRWVQLAVLPALLLIAWFALGIIGEAIFIFIVAALLALVLNPLVRGLERVHVPRALGVAIVYLVVIAVVAGIVALAIPPIDRQVRSLLDALPGMVQQARVSIQHLQNLADRLHVRVDVATQLQAAAKSIASTLLGASRSILGIGVSLVRALTVTVIIVVISIYMLVDARRISRFIAEHFPTGSVEDGREYVRRTQSAVAEYIKAQLLLSAAIGAGTGLTMWVLGVAGIFPSGAKYAGLFGVWAGVTEIIPYLGPVLGAIPPVIVALLHSPLTALWVIIAYVGIQEIEGHIAAPLIMGARFRVHPLLVVFFILAGNQVHGLIGMFVAVPLIPLARETYVFFRGRVRLEGWRHAVSRDILSRPEGPGDVGLSPDERADDTAVSATRETPSRRD
ncbi:MAG TPA: AI-2E family transporter [Thermoleophilia bacterium]|nr:AI-2E family transporter [Thermoleophilia bacterium]